MNPETVRNLIHSILERIDAKIEYEIRRAMRRSHEYEGMMLDVCHEEMRENTDKFIAELEASK